MRLSDVLSKEDINSYFQVDNFIGSRKPTIGQPRKLDTGKVALNFYCKDCRAIRTFISPKELSFIAISESMASIDVGLRCTACEKNTVPVWFIIDSGENMTLPSPKVRVLTRVIKYTDRVSPSNDLYGDYSILLDMVERAYQARLGAGALVYLRKLFEKITKDTAEAVGICDIYKENGRMKPFSQVLQKVDARAQIIPPEFTGNGYKLFSELSEVVHNSADEDMGLIKYSSLRRLVVGILDNMRNKRELLEAKSKLGWGAASGEDEGGE